MNQRYDCGNPVVLRKVTLKLTNTPRLADAGSTLMASAQVPGGAEIVGDAGARVGGRFVGLASGVAPEGGSVGKAEEEDDDDDGVEPSGKGTVGKIIGAVGISVTPLVTVIEMSAGSLAPPDALNARTLNVCVPAVAFHL